jgi:hypothetical protein
MKTISYATAVQTITSQEEFVVEFVKRSDGSLRILRGRYGVEKGNGGGKYDPPSKGLLCVWDVENEGYRSIPLEGLKRLRDENGE